MSVSRQSLARIMLVVVGLGLITGCSEAKPEHEYITLEGKALDVDPEDGVSMEFRNKKGITVHETGKVAEGAEVWINGRQAAVDDVQPGDHIKVTLRVEGSGMGKTFVATRIEVERDAFEPTSAPAATQPAAGAGKAPSSQP